MTSPPDYEAASRQRMADSDDPKWRTRAFHPDPVEGNSEIDVVLEGDDYLVYVEAKLSSDISLGTTYDPNRTQLARYVDCAIEECGDRQPLLWMVVKDRTHDRMYMRMIEEWRHEPSTLAAQLPHRNADDLRWITERIAVLAWAELLAGVEVQSDEIDVWRELQRRIN